MKQKLPKNHLFRFIFPLLYGSILYVLILLVFENFNAIFESFFSQEWLFTIALSYLSSEVLHWISYLLSKKLTFAYKIAKYIIIQVITTISIEFILVFIAIHIYFTWVEGFSVYRTELIVFELFYLFSVLLYNLFIFSYLLLNHENTLKNEQEFEFSQKNEYLIQAVQNEIDPEVFYTVMESLLVYIHKDEAISNEIINRLSLLYRYRLENKFNELISVNKERSALDNLVFLFNSACFGAIEYEFSESKECDNYLILPVWLQKIFLTVLRCNIITPLNKFKISIKYQDNSLNLRHIWREKLLYSEKIEIEKISSDFEFYTNRKIELLFDNELVTMIIPLLRIESEPENL